VQAQEEAGETKFIAHTTTEAGITASSNGTLTALAPSVNYYWGLGAKRKFEIGVGLRLTSSFGSGDYITAPAEYTGEESTIADFVPEATQINALNIPIFLRYDFTERWALEFNIDLVGLSFGGEQEGDLSYQSSVIKTSAQAKPTSSNLLLVGDNDKGSLNSEFMVQYRLNNNWKVRAGAVFLFNEYTLDDTYDYSTVTDVDRYRTKQMMFGLGVRYVLN